MKHVDVAVIGSGPAGLAASAAASAAGASAVIIERESLPGGILKQCIHDGFGLIRFGEKLTGPEYAHRYIAMVRERKIPFLLGTFLTRAEETETGYRLSLVNGREGCFSLDTRAIVLATGCRERTDRQVMLQGSRPAGVYTAGLAQYFINIQGLMPGRRCLILGSGDIGLIMARRITLEGGEVLGVHEIKGEPSGLTRNVVQCLDDYGIPLFLSSTVTKLHGERRLTGVTVARVGGDLNPIPGTEEEIACDTLILSVGLIPENEVAKTLGAAIDPATGGPVVDQRMMTSRPGVFSCGNSLLVNDLVDYVSENGEAAGKAAAEWAAGSAPRLNSNAARPGEGTAFRASEIPVSVEAGADVGVVVPQRLVLSDGGKVPVYLRSRRRVEGRVLIVRADGVEIASRKTAVVRPPEMERIVIDTGKVPAGTRRITVALEERE